MFSRRNSGHLVCHTSSTHHITVTCKRNILLVITIRYIWRHRAAFRSHNIKLHPTLLHLISASKPIKCNTTWAKREEILNETESSVYLICLQILLGLKIRKKNSKTWLFASYQYSNQKHEKLLSCYLSIETSPVAMITKYTCIGR